MKGTTVKAGIVVLLLCLTLSSASCRSDNGSNGGVGVEQREASTQHTISSDNLEVVQWLFQKNGLNLDRYEVIAFYINTACTDNLEASYYNVRAVQTYKGLPVFVIRHEYVSYGFNKDGDLVYTADLVQIHDVGKELSIEPAVSIERAQQIAVVAYPLEIGGHKLALTAELGFLDKQAVVGEGSEPEYALVWKVTATDLWYAAFVIVDATTGDILCAVSGTGL